MPARTKYQPPEDGVTEIRIHGVGGTGPDNLLDDPHPLQVAGDDRAGFYRRSRPESYDDPPPGKWTLEAYSWGGLTSRKASRASWILLLPFTLTNVAGWTVVHFTKAKWLSTVQERLCRLTGLCATVLTVAGIAAVTGDIASVQCGRLAACRSGHWWLSLFGSDTFAQAPLRRLVIGLIPAVVVLVILVLLGLRSRREYEEFKPVDAGEEASSGTEASPLAAQDFWYRPSFASNLTGVHLAAAVGTLALLLAVQIDELFVERGRESSVHLPKPGWLIVAEIVSLAIVGLAVAVALLMKRAPEPTEEKEARKHFLGKHRYGIFVTLSILCLGLTSLGAWTVRDAYPRGTDPLELGYPARGLQTFSKAPLYILFFAVAVVILIAFAQMTAWFFAGRKDESIDRSAKNKAGGGGGGRSRARSLDNKGVFILWSLLIGGVAAVLFSTHMWVVCIILGLELLAALWYFAFTTAAITVVGLVAELFARNGDRRFLHVVAIVAVLGALFILYDWLWPRREFRWGAPPVMGLLGIALLIGLFAGASTRASDYLDKRQSTKELTKDVTDLVDRLTEEGLAGERTDSAMTSWIEEEYGDGSPPTAEELRAGLAGKGIPSEITNRVFAFVSQGDRRPIDIQLPPAYKWVTAGIGGSLALALAAMALLFVAERFDRRPDDELRPPGDPPLTPGDERKIQKSVRKMKVLKQIAGAGDLLITFIVGLLAFGALLLLRHRIWHFVQFWHCPNYANFFNWTDADLKPGWEWLVTSSGWLVTALPLAAVAVIRKSYTNEASRRKIGIIWDLLTFWPRQFHPLAPPAYSERAVPELRQRLMEASEPGKCAVLAAHSQGTVVGYASLVQIPTQRFSRISLLTYGSPLGSYYRRFFPTYFRTEWFNKLEEDLQGGCGPGHSWRNFWRPTDPIAGCLFSYDEDDGRDKRVHDPWWWSRIPGQPLPHLQVHSDYMDDPELRQWVAGAATKCPKCPEKKAQKPEAGRPRSSTDIEVRNNAD